MTASVTSCLMVGFTLLAGVRLQARHHDNEADLLAHIQRETNPVHKAKYEIRLGSLKLQQAILAYDQRQLDQGQKLLDDYLTEMSKAWDLLRSSGRDASRKPDGFKQLDIALRENSRRLEDLRHRVPYMDRGPLDRVTEELDKTHNEVLVALFPGMKFSADSPKRDLQKNLRAPHLVHGSVRP